MIIQRTGFTKIEVNELDPSTGYRVTYDENGNELSRVVVTGLSVSSLEETVNEEAEQALALMVLCIADNDMVGAQQAAQMWKAAVGL